VFAREHRYPGNLEFLKTSAGNKTGIPTKGGWAPGHPRDFGTEHPMQDCG